MNLRKYLAAFVAAVTWSAPAFAAPIAPVGTTDVTVSAFFLGVLGDNGISAAPIPSATASGAVFSFDITGGQTDPLSIEHSGGVLFEKGSDSLSASNFVIDGVAGIVKANVNGDTGFAPIFDLAEVMVVYGTITADLLINDILAGAISETFFDGDADTSEFLKGKTFGFAVTSPQPVPVPASAVLLIAGLGGLAAVRRCKAAA